MKILGRNSRYATIFKKQWAFITWSIIFVAVLVVGMFGTRFALPVKVGPEHFWHCWELAALGSTIVFNLLFYVLGFFMPPRMFLRLRVQGYAGLFPLLMALIVGFLVSATFVSLNSGNCTLQLALLSASAMLLLVFDFTMAKQSSDDRVCQDFKASVLLNDLPVCIAFLVLFLYSLVYHFGRSSLVDDPPFRAFIGGAIAFQMLLSNWVLALIFRKPGEWYQEAPAK